MNLHIAYLHRPRPNLLVLRCNVRLDDLVLHCIWESRLNNMYMLVWNRVDSSEADVALHDLLGELPPGGIAALTAKLVTLGNADCELPYDGEVWFYSCRLYMIPARHPVSGVVY